jgi:hypothetical protein
LLLLFILFIFFVFGGGGAAPPLVLLGWRAYEIAQKLHRQWEDDGGVLLRRYGGQGLQVPAHRRHSNLRNSANFKK